MKAETGATERENDRARSLEAEIDRMRSLGLNELRSLWHTTMRTSPPPALTKDLLARVICWNVQEQALGGLDPNMAEFLDGRSSGNKTRAKGQRRLKPGTVLVREYGRERHTVTVVPGGYQWREATYPSLSAIAHAITGTKWNGPRFFGLRIDKNHLSEANYNDRATSAPTRRRGKMRA